MMRSATSRTNTMQSNALKKPTLAEVRADYAAHLYAIAVTLDQYVREGAGAEMLGVTPDAKPQDLDLSRFPSSYAIEPIYRYAFVGELTVPYIDDDEENGNLGQLSALVKRVKALNEFDCYYDDVCGMYAVRQGALGEMTTLAEARQQIDGNGMVDLEAIAKLAGIDIRSVRNALLLPPPRGLVGQRTEHFGVQVKCEEALRWLNRERRTFFPTVRVGSYTTPEHPVPERLTRGELVPFLMSRVHFFSEDEEFWFRRTAPHQLNWPEERIRAVFAGRELELSELEIAALSRVLQLDSAWLKQQFLAAKDARDDFPSQPSGASAAVSPYDATAQTLTVVLEDAGIRNGYFDIEMRWAEELFPADSFGDRSQNHGKPVELRFDDQTETSDIRRKSESRASPRKRFHAYFRRHRAEAGDKLVIKRVGERSYVIDFKPANRVWASQEQGSSP